MGLYRRPDSRLWQYKFSVDGRTIVASAKTEDRKLARAIFEQERAKYVRREKLGDIPDLRLKELIDTYLRDFSAGNKKSYKDDCGMAATVVAFYGENAMASEVTPQSLERFKAARLSKRVGDHGLSRSTVNRDLNFVSGVFAKGLEWRLVPSNPAKGVRRYKVHDKNRVRYLTPDEEKRLLAVLERFPLARRLTLIALRSGLRLSEIRNLKWTDLDPATGQIIVRVSKSGKPRYVPCHPDLVDLFRSLPKRGPYIVTDDGERTKFRTTGYHTLRIDHSKPVPMFGKWRFDFGKALSLAGIRDFRFHDTRHCYASALVQRGVSLQLVAELLGHSTLTMALRYAHLSHESRVAAVNLLPRLTAPAKEVSEVLTVAGGGVKR